MLKQKIESRMKHTHTLQSWENHPSASRLFGRTRTPAATLRAETPAGAAARHCTWLWQLYELLLCGRETSNWWFWEHQLDKSKRGTREQFTRDASTVERFLDGWGCRRRRGSRSHCGGSGFHRRFGAPLWAELTALGPRGGCPQRPLHLLHAYSLLVWTTIPSD